MKYITILFAFLALAFSASAQQLAYAAETLALPSVIAANSTTNVALGMDVRRQSTVALAFTLTGGSAATTNAVTLTFYQGLDGTTYASGNTFTTSAQTWVLYPNGTTATTVSTNLPVNGCGYIQLYSVLNHASNSYLTNCVLKYAIKTLAE